MTDRTIGKTIAEALDELESDERALVELCGEMVKAYGGAIYAFDLFAYGAANRSLGLSTGFRTMIGEQNFICAGALVRLQLDTAFRFYAGFLVDDPARFALDVFAGKHVRKLKDRDNKNMTDTYLVAKLSDEFPWVQSLYDHTCEYIHLSGTHISHAIEGGIRPDNTFTAKIGGVDEDISDSTYVDAIRAFQRSMHVFLHYLRGWVLTKDNPELVAKLKAERDTKETNAS